MAGSRYEKGARSNRREAKRVAQGIFDHFKNTKAESLGVIAFSEAQQMAIERELASLIRKEPEMSHYLVIVLKIERSLTLTHSLSKTLRMYRVMSVM